jgi:hypothetical protein
MDEYRDEQWQGRQGAAPGGPGGKPTIKQIYTVARALCERCGEAFPETRAAASELIGRLRGEHPGTKEAA